MTPADRLSAGEIQTHRQIGQRGKFEIHGIGDDCFPRNHPEGLASVHCNRAIAGGDDGGILVSQGDVGGPDIDRHAAERVGELES